MRIQYFEDTDTLYVVFKDAEVRETKDLDENTVVEYDAQGNLVSMTIEHARERVDMGSYSFQPVAAMRPVA
jgi:YD repeat-containing protein